MRRKVLFLSIIFVILIYSTISGYSDSTNPTIKLDKTSYSGLGDKIKITVTDPENNKYGNSAEHIALHIHTNLDTDGYYTYIQETESNSGIFTGNLGFSLENRDPKERTIKVEQSTKIYIKYKETTVQAVWQPDDAEVKLDKKSYGGYGVQAVVTLTDSDLNLSPMDKEEINIKVNSSSDQEGITIKLEETKPDSATFKGSFGFRQDKSDDINKLLKVSYSDTVTAIYNDKLHSALGKDIQTYSAVWKPSTGTLKLNKSSYIGLNSTGSVSVTDCDLNLRPDYRDIARIRLTSGADPQGFVILANETGINTGVFSGNFEFSSSLTNSEKATLMVNPTDKIVATYIDELNDSNKVNAATTASASFQFSEATIQTTAVNDEGTGNMIEITITEPDLNIPNVKDRIMAKAGAGSDSDELTLFLIETGLNTGTFKTKLYFTQNEANGRTLMVSTTDNINIKYIDNTLPQGGSKAITKNIKWTYQSTILEFDKKSYTGYNSTAKIRLVNMDLNKLHDKIDFVNVRISASTSQITNLKLEETGNDSGEFTGTMYFGKTANHSKGILKVINGDIVYVYYTEKSNNGTTAECSATWTCQNGELSLDRKEYWGYNIPVKITVKDWDLADRPDEKDEVKVTARVEGSAKYTAVTLTETYKNSGTFTGIVYINGSSGNKPSISLKPTDRLQIVYTDENTASGAKEDRIVYAPWGTSEAKLELDKKQYKGYGLSMNIKLTDPDQNKSTAVRDSVEVYVTAKNSHAKVEILLKETGTNTGIFTGKLKFAMTSPASGEIKVNPDDEITVTFADDTANKKVSASAGFKE